MLTNLGYALYSEPLQMDETVLAFTVLEDAVDLNGDLDTADKVLIVSDAGTGQATNLGLAIRWNTDDGFVVSDGLVAFLVDEREQGRTDLNGDADWQDRVLHVYDSATGTLTNVGLASLSSPYVAAGDGVVAFAVSEDDQGETDFNGDGDASDLVLHVFDPSSSSTTNLQIASVVYSSPTAGLVISGGFVGFLASESMHGSTDFNLDGDSSDPVVHVHEIASGVTSNLQLASQGFRARDGVIAFLVQEFLQGNADLNGDPDTSDSVLHLHDLSAGTTLNTGLAIDDRVGQPGFLVGTELVAVLADETNQQADLNLDGDEIDRVVHVFDIEGGVMSNLRLALPSPGFVARDHMAVAGPFMAFAVLEISNRNLDLNGDGDKQDSVLHLYSADAGVSINLGLAVATGFDDHGVALLPSRMFFLVDEESQAGTDLNGDGDVQDNVLHDHEINGFTSNTGIAAAPISTFFRSDGERSFLLVDELRQGATDLNHDGDPLDRVLHVYRSGSGKARNLRLSGGAFQLFQLGFDGDRLAIPASESAQGETDWNGDGDTTDHVVFLAEGF